MDTLFVFIVGQFLHSSQTDINQTSDPNRCECDPSIAPDTPINTPERLIYRLLPLRGWSVWRRSVKAADQCRQSDPVSRFTVQISGRLAVRFLFDFFFSPCCDKENISPSFEEFSNSLPVCIQKMSQRLSFFSPFFLLLLFPPDKNKVQRRSSETLFNQTLVNFSTPPHSSHAASRVLTVCN